MRKRYLTTDEINDIIESLPIPKGIPPKIRQSLFETACEFRSQLSRVQVYPAIIPKVKDFVHSKYASSLTPVGEMVGILAAQAMESFTQNTLNMFHRAGLSCKEDQAGLPRAKEIFNATENPKVIGFNFYPTEKYDSIESLRNSVFITEVKLNDLIEQTSITTNMDNLEDWFKYHDILFSTEYKKCSHRIRFLLNKEKVFRQSLTLLQIANELEKQLSTIFVVCSPMNTSQFIMDIFADTNGIPLTDSTFTQEECKKIYVNDIVLKTVKNIVVSGIQGVKATYPKNEKGSIYLEGNGGSLIDFLSNNQCDSTKTINDNMHDINQCLGIEATRTFLVGELHKVLTSDGTFVNPKHVMIVVDRMLMDGQIHAVNRYGMTHDNFSPLAMIAFEEPIMNMFKSAFYGVKDELNGVNPSIMTGRTAGIGTYMTKMLVDLKMLENAKEYEEPEEEFVIF